MVKVSIGGYTKKSRKNNKMNSAVTLEGFEKFFASFPPENGIFISSLIKKEWEKILFEFNFIFDYSRLRSTKFDEFRFNSSI